MASISSSRMSEHYPGCHRMQDCPARADLLILRIRTPQEATAFADPNDRASQESDLGVELRNRDRETNLIKKINEAITRVDIREYGYKYPGV
jgi:RNA polymerase-binding protein DksA